MLAGFVVVGGGLVAGYAALGDQAGPGSPAGGAATGTGGGATGGASPSGSGVLGTPDLPAPVVPPCDGSYVLIVGSVTTPVGHQAALAGLLDATPGARWFTTEGTCGSLRDRSDAGTLIHTVYLGPFPTVEAALGSCGAGPPDAYAKRLDAGGGPAGGVVTCP
jgi:serine/threonine-protein kinase